jgi:hypothetical protein
MHGLGLSNAYLKVALTLLGGMSSFCSCSAVAEIVSGFSVDVVVVDCGGLSDDVPRDLCLLPGLLLEPSSNFLHHLRQRSSLSTMSRQKFSTFSRQIFRSSTTGLEKKQAKYRL